MASPKQTPPAFSPPAPTLSPQDFEACKSTILQIVPRVDLDSPHNRTIINSGLSNAAKVEQILSAHFSVETRPDRFEHALVAEADRVHSLLPGVSFEKILGLLRLFQDMPNREEIVLRFLLMWNAGERASTPKRSGSHLDALNNNNSKARKLSETSTLNGGLYCEASTSGAGDAEDEVTFIDLTDPAVVNSTLCSDYEADLGLGCSKVADEIEVTQDVTSEGKEKDQIGDKSVCGASSSLDSCQTEIYSLDWADVNVEVQDDSLVDTSVAAEEESSVSKYDEIGDFDNSYEMYEPINNINDVASTSKQNGPQKREFNLITYVHEITDAPLETIKKYCKRLKLSTNVQPPIGTLQRVVSDILEITANSDDSDVDEDVVPTDISANSSNENLTPATPQTAEPPEDQLEILKGFLPDADPDHLRMMCDRFAGNPAGLQTFLDEAIERRNYPTMKEYQRRQQLSAQQKQYTSDFTVENFIKVIPDPVAFFSDPGRTVVLNQQDVHYAQIFLQNMFQRLAMRTIYVAFAKNARNVLKTVVELEAAVRRNAVMKSKRKSRPLPYIIENIPLLQELAYCEHKAEIHSYIDEQKQKEEVEKEEAKNLGLLKTCACCYDEEVLPRDIYSCEKGCKFCKSCIIKSSEVRFGEGKLDFPCLMDCGAILALQTLQAVLAPKLFSKIAQKKALEEVKAAGIEELEMCPFCDFATIPAEGYTIFTCMNPECMKESCRKCKEPSHVPLGCDEIEKDEQVKARTFVENQMTEALLRACYKCGVKFFKEEGCNLMTCSCGAQMCYVCNQPVRDYRHFNGNGGDQHNLCPLYSNTKVFNQQNVLEGAKKAKASVANVELKFDPAANLEQERTRARRPRKKTPRRRRRDLLMAQMFAEVLNPAWFEFQLANE